jgi:hypothetical protein
MKYEDYEMMCFKLAHMYAHHTPLSYPECLEAVTEAYVRAVETWDTNLGAFSTWLYNLARGEVSKEMGRYECGKHIYFTIEDFVADIPAPDANLMFEDMLDKLSNDAKTVAQLALDVEVEYESNLPSLRKMIRQGLRKIGWQERRITKAFQEVRQAVV